MVTGVKQYKCKLVNAHNKIHPYQEILMSQPEIKQLKAEDLSAEEIRLQKAQQVIDDLYVAAKQDETLKEQLEAVTSPESLVEVAARQGYELTVADLETLRRRTQQQAQLNSDEFDDELSEQELELVAGGWWGLVPISHVPRFPNWPPRRPPC
jgi:predicted ribosomally synthesized peptide with nif11-like leader